MDMGVGPMACSPGAGHDCHQVDTSLHVTNARSARVADGPPLMSGTPAMIYLHCEDGEVKERSGGGRVLAVMLETCGPDGVVS